MLSAEYPLCEVAAVKHACLAAHRCLIGGTGDFVAPFAGAGGEGFARDDLIKAVQQKYGHFSEAQIRSSITDSDQQGFLYPVDAEGNVMNII